MSSFAEFCNDYLKVMQITNNASAKSYTYQRLKLLELKHTLYKIINSGAELAEQKVKIF